MLRRIEIVTRNHRFDLGEVLSEHLVGKVLQVADEDGGGKLMEVMFLEVFIEHGALVKIFKCGHAHLITSFGHLLGRVSLKISRGFLVQSVHLFLKIVVEIDADFLPSIESWVLGIEKLLHVWVTVEEVVELFCKLGII